ncbi:unnamed protein product [Bursaphelenchus okinawaensis]|uniref:7TM_GPCR_Srx domain-containing protein n=1 Tax=Bursaphelenchus okinawaensis TaxID=465554 RepID=A0A811JRW9_9BILA|nr:unnamed protein product [Bursaphelenchus okinawaensis]CAG9080165.1 unnamed protein product [Bursaphelenchus okinawaensis]
MLPNTSAIHPEAWSNNPYAWDIPDPDGIFRPQNHNGIPLVRAIVKCLYASCGVFGGMFSLMLLSLVWFQSTGNMKSYARMLMLCCASDIGFWFCDTIVQVVS